MAVQVARAQDTSARIFDSVANDIMQKFLRALGLCCVMVGLAASSASQQLASREQASASVNYAEIRTRVQHSFPEKANEIADIIDVLQDITKSTVELSSQISAHCS